MGSLRPFYQTNTTSMTHNSRQKALRGEYLKPRLSVLVWKMLTITKARPKKGKPMSIATPMRTQRRYTTTALLSPLLLDSPKSNTKLTIDEWLRSLAADVPYRRENQLSGNSQSKLGNYELFKMISEHEDKREAIEKVRAKHSISSLQYRGINPTQRKSEQGTGYADASSNRLSRRAN